MQILFGVLVAAHGLITLAIGAGTMSSKAVAVAAPGTDWYPVALGQSWLLHGDVAKVGGGLWLIAGVGLVATAAAIFGFVLPTAAWPTLALMSAVMALLALATFFHPYYAVGIAANLAIIAAVTVFRSAAKNAFGI
jgi:hypothetical protein